MSKLKLADIHKYYRNGEVVHALRGISLEFKENEFVSILGPSGCGKTTLLNIIGGLDRYDSGGIELGGLSTKNFNDVDSWRGLHTPPLCGGHKVCNPSPIPYENKIPRCSAAGYFDWDAYRNRSIGFVFQNYNLITHQTVLQNVEIALTLSGITAAERRRRAKEALASVGLSDQIMKKPNQLSGGQTQRVAIARALVNNPEIILADEPTGSLDSQASVQLMEILKEISKTRLVILVTHNIALADKYSSRIIQLLDGETQSDSNPLLNESEKESEAKRLLSADKKTLKKTSMSMKTAVALSFMNLLTKRGRSITTAIAGSIGIIGVALVLALSTGLSNYMTQMQTETLVGLPIIIADGHYVIDRNWTEDVDWSLSGGAGEADK